MAYKYGAWGYFEVKCDSCNGTVKVTARKKGTQLTIRKGEPTTCAECRKVRREEVAA